MSKILIVGGTKGIGKAIAQKFAKQGHDLVLTYAHDTKNAQSVANELITYSVQVTIIQADSSYHDQIKQVFRQEKDISVLINNVGSSFPHTGATNREGMFQYHLMSPVHYTEEFAKQLSGEGAIINITSVLGNNPGARHKGMRLEAYCCMKSAVEMYTKICATKYAGKIRVNAISPGNTLTPSRNGTDPEFVEQRKNNSCIKRFINPAEIAEAVYALIQNKGINGQSLTIDGGEIGSGYV